MGPFLLSLCAFLCVFYPFVCERDRIKQDAEWSTEPAGDVPRFAGSGAVFHAERFLGRRNAVKNKSTFSLPWPYLSLPVFQHSVAPLVNKELMKPARATGNEPMPVNLKKVLLPDARRNQTAAKPASGRRDVIVSCTTNKMLVKVCKKSLGSRASSSQLSLGTCYVSNETQNFFLFSYYVSQCGSNISMINNRVVYSNTLYYTPEEPKGLIRTAVPFALQIFCHYNRFYYSYKIGYLPEIKTHQFFKNMKPSSDFTLTACNAQWERLPETQGYVIGSTMYFEARTPSITGEQRLYISFCYATPSQDASNKLSFMVIKNYGCMTYSKDTSGRSRFVRHRRNVLRFTLEAFIFEGVADERLYMHCEMFVADRFATEIAKSCTYNTTTGRWEELYGNNQVCTCCDSTCLSSASAAEHPATKKMISSGSWMLEPDGGAVAGEATVEWDEITPVQTAVVTKPTATTVTEPVTMMVTEPEIRIWTEPEIRTWTEAEIWRWTQPMTTTMTEPVIKRGTQAVTVKMTEPVIKRGTQAVTVKMTEPVIKRGTQAVTVKMTEPEIKRGTQPVTAVVTTPGIKRWTDKVTKETLLTGSAVEEAEKPHVPRLSFKEVFGIH